MNYAPISTEINNEIDKVKQEIGKAIRIIGLKKQRITKKHAINWMVYFGKK